MILSQKSNVLLILAKSIVDFVALSVLYLFTLRILFVEQQFKKTYNTICVCFIMKFFFICLFVLYNPKKSIPSSSSI